MSQTVLRYEQRRIGKRRLFQHDHGVLQCLRSLFRVSVAGGEEMRLQVDTECRLKNGETAVHLFPVHAEAIDTVCLVKIPAHVGILRAAAGKQENNSRSRLGRRPGNVPLRSRSGKQQCRFPAVAAHQNVPVTKILSSEVKRIRDIVQVGVGAIREIIAQIPARFFESRCRSRRQA